MAIIIKGMEMPKYCNECRFVIDSFGECTLEHEKIEDYDFFDNENKRPEWCPLTSTDELIDKICETVTHEFNVNPTTGYDIAEKIISD